MDRGAWQGYSPWGHKEWDLMGGMTLSLPQKGTRPISTVLALFG